MNLAHLLHELTGRIARSVPCSSLAASPMLAGPSAGAGRRAARGLVLALVSCVALLLAAPRGAAQGQLWIVDQAGGPGFDFTAVQPAIDAAADGDTVLLRPGTYGDFVVNGKALEIVEDAGAIVKVGEVSVLNIAASQSASLRGFVSKRMLIQGNAGPVHVENVGDPPLIPICGFTGGASLGGMEISSSSNVTLARCHFKGTDPAAPGIRILSSTVHAYEVAARGAQGAQGQTTPGGPGMHVSSNSFLFASGGSFAGGCGSDAGLCGPAPAPGGTGLVISGSTVYLLEVKLLGGQGGDGFDCSADAPDGAPKLGFTIAVAGHPRDYQISAVGIGGGSATISYAGVAGDLVFSLVALSQSPLFLLSLAGSLTLSIPPIVIAHGAAPSGQLSIPVALPPLPPGVEAFTIYTQGAALSPVGAAVLAAPSVLTIR